MADAIIFVVVVMAVIVVAGCYVRTLRRGGCGCGCSGGDEAHVARPTVADTDEAHYPYAVRVEIGGMTCRNCRLRVENALNSEEGLWARVDLAAGSALVRSRHPLSEERLRLVIGREGYTVGAITPA